MERAVYRSDGNLIETVDFNPFRNPFCDTPVDNDNKEESNLPQEFKYELKDFSKAHEDLDTSYLSRALDASGGNQRIAASSLGLTYDQFRGLYRKYKNRLK